MATIQTSNEQNDNHKKTVFCAAFLRDVAMARPIKIGYNQLQIFRQH
ncbi:hypothetical protein [Acidocella facilis]|nr:hypothetical protein [Acidocella facilis]